MHKNRAKFEWASNQAKCCLPEAINSPKASLVPDVEGRVKHVNLLESLQLTVRVLQLVI